MTSHLSTFVNKNLHTEHSLISQHNSTNNNLLFNIRQQEYYLVTVELKCHNLCAKYPPFSLAQVWIRISHPRYPVAVTLSRVTVDRT